MAEDPEKPSPAEAAASQGSWMSVPGKKRRAPVGLLATLPPESFVPRTVRDTTILCLFLFVDRSEDY